MNCKLHASPLDRTPVLQGSSREESFPWILLPRHLGPIKISSSPVKPGSSHTLRLHAEHVCPKFGGRCWSSSEPAAAVQACVCYEAESRRHAGAREAGPRGTLLKDIGEIMAFPPTPAFYCSSAL